MTQAIPTGYIQRLAQLAAADRDMKALNDQLRADGWVWSDEAREWTHPDKPGSSISY